MSPNGRREGSKIVAPLTPNREAEIAGGLKNALDRGEPLTKAKQSFLNAGYKPAEIAAAVQKMPAASSQISNTVKDSRETKTPEAQPKPEAQAATTTKMPGQPKKLSKKFIIILVSSAALILILAALLGIFWDKLF